MHVKYNGNDYTPDGGKPIAKPLNDADLGCSLASFVATGLCLDYASLMVKFGNMVPLGIVWYSGGRRLKKLNPLLGGT